MSSSQWRRNTRRYLQRRPFSVYYHDEYRWTLGVALRGLQLDARAPERLMRYLVYEGFVSPTAIRRPRRVTLRDLARLHSPERVNEIRGGDASKDVTTGSGRTAAVSSNWRAARLVAGGTLAAAQAALSERRPSVNLAGGFIPTPEQGGDRALLIDDIGTAVAALRASGYRGHIAVVHRSRRVKGPITSWSALEGPVSVIQVSELMDADIGDSLGRAHGDEQARPKKALDWDTVDLAFVVGEVADAPSIDAERFEGWLEEVRRRDEMLVHRLHRAHSVWLPGGAFSKGAWRAFAGTLHVLADERDVAVPSEHPSWRERFVALAAEMPPEVLSGSSGVGWSDVATDLGLASRELPKFLGYYTAEGIEIALRRYGVLAALERLGYGDFRIELGSEPRGHWVRLLGNGKGRLVRLADCLASREVIEGRPVLYLHWLNLRDPLATFEEKSGSLPGQDAPGLGVIEELAQAVGASARRLALDGVALVPAWYHTAFIARRHARFLDAMRQARFEGLMEFLGSMPLVAQSEAVHSGRVQLDGALYEWEPDVMVSWVQESAAGALARGAPSLEQYRGRFRLVGDSQRER